MNDKYLDEPIAEENGFGQFCEIDCIEEPIYLKPSIYHKTLDVSQPKSNPLHLRAMSALLVLTSISWFGFIKTIGGY
jgi:hypothetical protein